MDRGRSRQVYILVQPQPAAEEENREDTDEEDESAAGHLVDGHRCVQ